MCGRGGRSSVSTVCVGTMCALGESEAKNACEATGGKVLETMSHQLRDLENSSVDVLEVLSGMQSEMLKHHRLHRLHVLTLESKVCDFVCARACACVCVCASVRVSVCACACVSRRDQWLGVHRENTTSHGRSRALAHPSQMDEMQEQLHRTLQQPLSAEPAQVANGSCLCMCMPACVEEEEERNGVRARECMCASHAWRQPICHSVRQTRRALVCSLHFSVFQYIYKEHTKVQKYLYIF